MAGSWPPRKMPSGVVITVVAIGTIVGTEVVEFKLVRFGTKYTPSLCA